MSNFSNRHDVNNLIEEYLYLFVPSNGCELAFDLASQGDIQESKGLSRALKGTLQGAFMTRVVSRRHYDGPLPFSDK
jgi:hypothetical protein